MRLPRLHLDRWPLGRRLAVAMLLVAALAIAGLFYDLSWVNRREIERFQTDHLSSYAQELARGLDALVRDETARITNLSRSRSVREFIAVRPGQRSALFTPTLDDFTNFVDSNPFYRAVLLLDRNGEALISTEGSYVGQHFAESVFFQQAIQGQATMSDPGISTLDRQPVIWLAAPVFVQRAPQAGAGAAAAGVVAVALAPDEIWQPVERLKVGQQGYAMLLDQYGIRLAHGADRRYIFRSLAPLAPETQAALRAQGRFAPGFRIADTGSLALLDYVRREPLPPIEISRPGPASEPVYYSAARMQTRSWTIVTMLSERELLAPADRVTLSGLGATLLLAALLGITVWWMAQWLVRPVPRLATAAAKIARGDLSTPIEVRGSSEAARASEHLRGHAHLAAAIARRAGRLGRHAGAARRDPIAGAGRALGDRRDREPDAVAPRATEHRAAPGARRHGRRDGRHLDRRRGRHDPPGRAAGLRPGSQRAAHDVRAGRGAAGPGAADGRAAGARRHQPGAAAFARGRARAGAARLRGRAAAHRRA
ncbi:MAG: HAMP domain-containing protein [Kouleothrix sp.]|nr:HAMP domain-containing protein [Kouleothrix sp.]